MLSLLESRGLEYCVRSELRHRLGVSGGYAAIPLQLRGLFRSKVFIRSSRIARSR